VQDQMRQMLSMNIEQGVDGDMSVFANNVGHRPTSSSGYGDMYRTDSPAPFSSDSPLPYVGETYGVRSHFTKHGLYSDIMDPGQYPTADDGYYSTVHPQHVTM
jgi:hypothetical protein